MLRAEVEEVHEIATRMAKEEIRPILARLREMEFRLAKLEAAPPVAVQTITLNPDTGGKKK